MKESKKNVLYNTILNIVLDETRDIINEIQKNTIVNRIVPFSPLPVQELIQIKRKYSKNIKSKKGRVINPNDRRLRANRQI